MVATFAAVTTLLPAAKSRSELIAAAQTIQHVGSIDQRERLSRVFKRRSTRMAPRRCAKCS